MTERQKLGANLDPALREWADRVIIPALAREYLAQAHAKGIATKEQIMAQSKAKTGLSAEVTP